MRNQQVAAFLDEVADILELQGVRFKPLAYRKAARSVASLEEPVETVGDLTALSGVGEAIAKKITEILDTGKLEYLEKLRKEIPEGIQQLMVLPGVGPKTAHQLASQGIFSVEELEKALEHHRLQNMKGVGPKTEENLKRSIQLYTFRTERRLLSTVRPLCLQVQAAFTESPDTVIIAGSVRRWKETVGDIDIVVVSAVPETTIETFTQLPVVEQVISKGSTKSSVILQGGIQSDVLVVPREMAGSALQYVTGSKEHNIRLRTIALQKGYTLHEYGLFERNSKKKVAGESEEDIYRRLELQYIPPELRENRGEIEAAQKNALPDLVNMSQIRGDFHVHTEWSDGRDSIESMVSKAQKLHYCYIGVCDHSQSSRIANGLSEEKLLDQNAFIKELNDRVEGITVLSGIECDILPDGSLDYADSLLEQLDFVTASVHSRFTSSEKENTQRVVSAMENPLVNILAHPTCRIIGKRDPLPLDFETLFQSAKDTKTALEINCYPDRLDLSDILTKHAVEAGVALALGTDAHSIHDLDFMELGVRTARRGWAEPGDLLNTSAADDLIRTILI